MFTLSDEQKRRYREDGFVIVESIIDSETVEAVKSRFPPLFERNEYETGVRPDEVNLPQGDPPYTQQICNAWRADLAVARVVMDPGIGKAIAELGGWPGTRIQIDNLLWKPARGRPIGFHQDSAYETWLDKPDMVTCWIALDQTSADGGPIMYVRSSHRWGQAKPILQFHGPDDDLAEAREWAARHGQELELVPVVVPPGGGAFHSGWTWHGSRVNRSKNPRRSMSIHCISSEARYNPENLSVGTGPIYGRYMKFGSTDLDDSAFPITWHEDGRRSLGLDDFLKSGYGSAA